MLPPQIVFLSNYATPDLSRTMAFLDLVWLVESVEVQPSPPITEILEDPGR